MKPVIVLELSEANVVKLMLDFLREKELFLSHTSIEKETGVTNYNHPSDDASFLRDLVKGGNWNDVLDFVQPLFEIADFPKDICSFIVLKAKYLEMLCFKAEITSKVTKCDDDFRDIINCLKIIEPICPNKEEFRDLCFLLNLNNLNESPHYSKFTPFTIREKCFIDLLKIVEPYFPFGLPMPKSSKTPAANRLKNLLIKGILYETCVDLCTQRALANDMKASEQVVANVTNRNLLNGPELSDADAGLVSWLESLPNDVYLQPFEQRSLELRFHSLESQVSPVKPSWAEYVVSQNLSERSRLISQAVCAHFQIQTTADIRESVDRKLAGPKSSSREPALRSSNVSDDKTNQSLVSAYTNNKLSNVTQSQPHSIKFHSPKHDSKEDALGSGASLHYSSSPAHYSKLEGPPNSAGFSSSCKSLSDAKVSIISPSSDVRLTNSSHQDTLQKNLSGHESISPTVPPAKSPRNPTFIDQNGSNRSGPNQGHSINQSLAPPVSIVRPGSSSQNRTRSTSPPARVRPSQQEYSSAPATESVKSLLQFTPVTVLEDTQPVRAVAIHQPSGKFYAVGSNSRNLRICYYPDINRSNLDLENSSRDSYNNVPVPAKLVLQIQKYHRGSIFCLAWNSRGDLLASGSNDKSVKLIHFDAHHQTVGAECEFTHHDATVRDLCFLGDNDVLVSAGQGDCRVYILDCQGQRVIRSLPGHSDHIFSLSTLSGNNSTVISGSRDKSIRLWDVNSSSSAPIFVIETPSPVNTIHTSAILSPASESRPGIASGSSFLLSNGLANGVCQLRDLRVPNRILAEWQPHSEEIRSVHLHPSLPFILSGSYDSTVSLTSLSSQGGVIDLQHISNTHKVGVHLDKVVKCCWHPSSSAPLSFLSASADKTVVCWVQQQYQPLQKSTTGHIPSSRRS